MLSGRSAAPGCGRAATTVTTAAWHTGTSRRARLRWQRSRRVGAEARRGRRSAEREDVEFRKRPFEVLTSITHFFVNFTVAVPTSFVSMNCFGSRGFAGSENASSSAYASACWSAGLPVLLTFNFHSACRRVRNFFALKSYMTQKVRKSVLIVVFT